MESSSACPTHEVADLLGKKWTLPLIEQIKLNEGIGFNSLMKSMKKISPKILAERLKTLERQEILRKGVRAEESTKTRYALTEKGTELHKLLISFRRWNEKHCPDLVGCAKKECVKCENY